MENISLRQARRTTAAGMCMVCKDRPKCAGVRRNECPRNRWPDREGNVKWLGVRWAGMPAPLRWKLQADHVSFDPDSMPGCGCVVILKRLLHGRGSGCGCSGGRSPLQKHMAEWTI